MQRYLHASRRSRGDSGVKLFSSTKGEAVVLDPSIITTFSNKDSLSLHLGRNYDVFPDSLIKTERTTSPAAVIYLRRCWPTAITSVYSTVTKTFVTTLGGDILKQQCSNMAFPVSKVRLCSRYARKKIIDQVVLVLTSFSKPIFFWRKK